MDQLEISVEENELGSWRERCNRRIESPKAREFSNSHHQDQLSESILLQQQTSSDENIGVIFFEFQEAVQNSNDDQFVNVLDQMLSSTTTLLTASRCCLFWKRKIAEIISHYFPGLLTKKNIYGDTPLHVAARSNSSLLIEIILSEYNRTASENDNDDDDEKSITRITNEYGNTALHEAVCRNNLQGAAILFYADKHVVHYLNNSGVSPLYLAVQSSNEELVNLWLEEDLSPDNISLTRSHGISPLHAAISTKNTDLLKLMVEKESYLNLMNLRDEHGGTPMHFAALTGYVEGVRILLEKSTLTAQEYDMKGQLPIHLASKQGHVEVVKEFCERKKKISLRGLINKKGQNILHVAAKHGQEDVVKYLLRNASRLVERLDVNKKDKNGNTPLHLGVENLHYSTVLSLTLDKRTEVNLTNNEGLTARDIVLLKRGVQRGVVQEMTNLVLKFSGAKPSDKAKGLLKRRGTFKADVMKNKMDTLMIVAILIVIVTFMAGFTVPGGVYSSDDPNPHNRGTAILAHKPMFKIFALFNMVALYSSIFGSFFLLWAQIAKFSPSRAFTSALFMVGLALLSMTLSFMAALSLVATHAPWISSLTIFIGISSFCAILIWSNASWSIILVSIISSYRDEIFKIFLSVIASLSAVTLLAIVVSGPIMLLLYLGHVVN
ncbi:protein ACCELERATED CELL DEATH 6-like [Prosopis cineraria]|uniref:protein ACCELERATED CELL DEATH 6-like n=1 Tax=Prosopis cineraria TaxID=364024 RepID=UPI00241066EF|nr:protein ACCELERATED CELL DEATH 6-like [Prosopis cineraria]